MKTQPLDIYIYCDGLELDGDTLKKRSCGGAETSGAQLAKALSDLGNKVTVFSECEGRNTSPGIYDGVEYKSCRHFLEQSLSTPFDVLIASRRHKIFNFPHKSKVNILWTQDHAWLNDKEDLYKSLWNMDSIFALSKFHKAAQASTWDLPEEYFWDAGNGVDLEQIGEVNLERDPKKLIYASRPERGLDITLLNVFPELLKHDPKLKLYITTYNNFPPQIVMLINQLKELSKPLGDSVVWLPPQNKQQLYKHFKTASALTYLSGYEEGYCIILAEAQACGLPVITGDAGPIPEVLHPDAGFKISGYKNVRCESFYREAVNRTLEVLNNKELWNKMSKAGIEHAKNLDWKVRAKIWDKKIRELLQAAEKKQTVSAIVGIGDRTDRLMSCIESVAPYVDQVVIGNASKTVSNNKLRELTNCKVFKFNSQVSIGGNEALRNECLKRVDSDWVLWLNQEDQLLGGRNLRRYLKSNPFKGYYIKQKHVRELNSSDTFPDKPARLFRKQEGVSFLGMLYERPGIDKAGDIGKVGDCEDIFLLNTDTREDIKKYYEEKFPLLISDTQKYSGRLIGLAYYMRDLMYLAKKAMENVPPFYLYLHDNKPKIELPSNVEGWCHEVIDLYRKYFLGEDTLLVDFVSPFYSEANSILNQGIDVTWNMAFDKIDSSVKNIPTSRARFANLEDAKLYFKSKIRSEASPYLDKWCL
jgi:glycosyltransferase involved in cell wall biosynthesis